KEERLVRHERVVLRKPAARLGCEILGEVIALLGRALRPHRPRALDEGGIELARLAADEAIEVLEAAAGRPAVERTGRAPFPRRCLVALAELRSRVAVEAQYLRDRRRSVGTPRGVARRRRCHVRHGSHAYGMMIAPGEQRLPRGGAHGGGVEAR